MINILEESKKIESNLIEYRRQIHSNPELSFKEYKTSEFIQKILSSLNISFDIIAETGVVALIGEKSENCVALRADIDALPLQEETGLEFSSMNNGVMHACGHDMHTTMLLGAAIILKSIEKDLKGCVKLIFQPAEESLPGGASILIKNGVLTNPVPKAVLGQHVSPGDDIGNIAIGDGYIMASADELYWTITGKGAHAAQPHLGNDTILAASNLILTLQSAISRFRNPLSPGVLSVTSFHGGSATNIIPEKVELKGTLRAFDNTWRHETINRIKQMSEEICSLYGCKAEFNPILGYPALFNNKSVADNVFSTASELFGNNRVTVFEPKMWAEDFAYYAQEIPSAFWFIGVKPKNILEMPGLHNPKFAPDESILTDGAALLAQSAVNFLNKL